MVIHSIGMMIWISDHQPVFLASQGQRMRTTPIREYVRRLYMTLGPTSIKEPYLDHRRNDKGSGLWLSILINANFMESTGTLPM
ncbi:hypothetical protein L484_025436 [Morus notabilis]|uniref:Uncharacterized protein n=1 Tax=Morus notabilis TaxID=981085 RepID=W9RCY7_9ROSA|nr:hypothetical protein L484_025436 [Morus notabilis]